MFDYFHQKSWLPQVKSEKLMEIIQVSSEDQIMRFILNLMKKTVIFYGFILE